VLDDFGAKYGWAWTETDGLVSKRRDRPYQAGRSKHWIKLKNRNHPAMQRVIDDR
jgi:ATP-dependent DNA ligase